MHAFLVTYLTFPSFVFYNLCSTKSFILHSISSVKINYISFRLIFYRLYFTIIHVDETHQSNLAMQTTDYLVMQTTTNYMLLPWNRQLQRITYGFHRNAWITDISLHELWISNPCYELPTTILE